MCSENKGADQLRVYREADLCLCSHMQNVGFLMTRSYEKSLTCISVSVDLYNGRNL